MKIWQDQGNGRYKLTVSSDDAEDGTPMQVFYGSKEEIADKLADAHGQASKRISQLKRDGTGPNQPTSHTRPLTAAERMQTVADLANPATVDRAVTRILESTVGSVDALRESAANAPEERQERSTREATACAQDFAENTPDWAPTDHNKNTLVRYMQSQGLSPNNRANYTEAFEKLTAAGLLQVSATRADDENDEPPAERQERIAPTPPTPPKAPTRFSTGINSRDVSGEQPRPTNRLKWTREQIANMSAATKKGLINDPEYIRAVEYHMTPQRRRAG